MNRYASDNRPRVKPVQRIELDGKNKKRRVILAAFFAIIGITALICGFMRLLGTEEGWDTIKPLSSSYKTCGGDFLFQYELGTGDVGPSAEKKEIQRIYTEACEEAYWMFNTDEVPDRETVEDDALLEHNLCYINGHPGQDIEIKIELYNALKNVKQKGNRLIYLGPLYNRYDDIFYCQDDSQAEEFDPYSSKEAAESYARLAQGAADPSAVDLQLMPENRVRLVLSRDYEALVAHETDSKAYIDFFWLKNAFIIDYLAEALTKAGYTKGTLNSFDGCVRNLDEKKEIKENKFAINIYNLDEKEHRIDPVDALEYRGALSAVSLRDYRRTEADKRFFYEYDNGVTRSSYISLKDGRCHSVRHDLCLYSRDLGCGQILLEVVGLWIDGSPDELEDGMKALEDKRISGAWYDGERVRYTGRVSLAISPRPCSGASRPPRAVGSASPRRRSGPPR